MTQLDYASRPPPWYRRQDVRRWLRRIVVVVAAGLVIYGGYLAYLRARMRYWEGRAMRYSAPADRTVFEEEPAAASKLVAGDARYHRSPMYLAFAGYVPAEFHGLRPNWEPVAVAFLGERRAPGRVGRIVAAVVVVGQAFDERHEVSLYAVAIEPGAVGAASVVGHTLGDLALHAIDRGRRLSDQPLLRLYAGQSDPADASHFTIRYELGGQRGTIDGWLRGDDSVSLKVRARFVSISFNKKYYNYTNKTSSRTSYLLMRRSPPGVRCPAASAVRPEPAAGRKRSQIGRRACFVLSIAVHSPRDPPSSVFSSPSKRAPFCPRP